MSSVNDDDAILLQTLSDGVLTLTLNRPDQFNALSSPLLDALRGAIEAAGRRAEVRVVVIAAAGRAFCAGHDLAELRASDDPTVLQAIFERCSRLMLAIRDCPRPVVARVHGVATAAGCQLVAQCDLAVAADSARFAVSGVNLGLFCSTPAVALSRNLGRKRALEMLFTGQFIDAATASDWGLVNRVVPAGDLDAAVAALTDSLLAKAPEALALGKQGFYRQAEVGLDAAYAMATDTMVCNMAEDSAREGIDGFVHKRHR